MCVRVDIVIARTMTDSRSPVGPSDRWCAHPQGGAVVGVLPVHGAGPTQFLQSGGCALPARLYRALSSGGRGIQGTQVIFVTLALTL